MINWLWEQQLVLSLVMLLLIVLEAKAIHTLGPKTVYALWSMLPLCLIANNLPNDLVSINQTSMYHYLVTFNSNDNAVNVSVNWQWVWLAGAVYILAGAARSQYKLMQLPQTPIAPAQLNIELPANLIISTTPALTSPILTGLVKSKLLLPDNFQSQFTPCQQRLMLAHELVHHNRKDNIYNLLAMVLLAVCWFNPLSWIAYRSFRQSQELACDADVLKQANTSEKISYSKALVSCAEHALHHFSIYSPYTRSNNMKKRIQRIQTTKHIKPAFIGLSIAISSLFVGSLAVANIAETTHKVSQPSMAIPIMRVEPKYPVQAAQDNIEGSVILQFDITKNGSTDNITVLDSFPKSVFNKTAIAALEQWQYKPRIQGGKAQRQTGLTVQLDYRMDKPYDGQTAKTSTIEKIKVQH
ncbi:MAG: M56 family metallopeptidase [Paraglaciecola sp.]|uniref:M56 family metallopeptidase n=1 Tax=Paraglaciecola sp. TaxID=1920173 RepID=UPI00326603A8